MVEKLSHFRKSEQTGHPNVRLYRFISHAIQIPEDKGSRTWQQKMLRFAEIQEEFDRIRQNNSIKTKRKKPIPKALIEERQQLQNVLDPYLRDRFRGYRKSILKNSKSLPRNPHARGKDSHVFFFGSIPDFLAHSETPRYVTKYSVPEREVGPDNIEYLQKKYKLLRALLPEHIPRAWFVFGEFRHGIPKHELGDFRTSLRAITIQREIRGKTFSEMSSEERNRPEVQRALIEAIQKYLEVRAALRKACKESGVNPKTFELSLDIGDATPDSGNNSNKFIPEEYASPNVMYDENFKRVFFIDMGWGTWNPDKERVYQYVINGQGAGHEEQKED